MLAAMFTSLAEWIVLVGFVVAVSFILKPLQKKLARKFSKALRKRGVGRGQAPIIDITPFQNKSKKEDKDYEN